jgi:DNA-binding protein WhiA
MSFAARTKKELTQLRAKPCCQTAELTALVEHCGILLPADGGRPVLDLTTENAAIARRIYMLVRERTQAPLEVVVQRKMRLKKNNIYTVRLRKDCQGFLEALGLLERGAFVHRIPQAVLRRTCCRKAYLRGAFLAGGSVNDPDGTSYHLEILSKTRDHGEDLLRLLAEFELHGRLIVRKKGFVAYIKEGEKIVEFLGLVGAHQALLHFEDVRIVKGMRNQVNRLVNCETANLNKTISAAVRQLENIRLIEREIGLDRLPEKLRAVAEKRLEFPEITLQELCDALPGKVSKSGLNHRLVKLDELARQIRERQGAEVRVMLPK